MNGIKTAGKVVDIITKIFAIIAALALIFNVLIILANVVLRAMGSSVIGAEEYVSLAEVVVIFFALGFTQFNRGLVHVCMFMKKIPGIGSVVMWAIHMWLATVVVALLVYETWVRIPAVKQVTQSLLIPLQPFYYVLLVGAIVYFIAQLFEAVKATTAIFNKGVREDVVANWPA